MNNSMISAMVAMSGIQQKLGVVSDNIANADTVGYKGKQATFEDVFTAVKQQPGAASALPGRVTGSGYNLGFGARMSDVTLNTAQGEMQTTNNPTDLAIQGDGMFAVSADGKQGWTREGSFHFVPSATDPTKAFMATDQGYLLMGKNARGVSAPLEVPAKTNIQIDDKGIVRSTDAAGKITVLPQTVQVDRVIHPEGLTQMDGNLFMLPTGANLNDVVGTMSPTTQIRQGFLEGSNVDLSAEMSELITVQRAYQLAARTLSSSDNMMSITNSIRG